jgi:hypothetical protein
MVVDARLHEQHASSRRRSTVSHVPERCSLASVLRPAMLLVAMLLEPASDTTHLGCALYPLMQRHN